MQEKVEERERRLRKVEEERYLKLPKSPVHADEGSEAVTGRMKMMRTVPESLKQELSRDRRCW